MDIHELTAGLLKRLVFLFSRKGITIMVECSEKLKKNRYLISAILPSPHAGMLEHMEYK
jgi:hypothetical protein